MKVLFLATTILTALTIGAAPVASAGGAQKMPGGGWFGHSGGQHRNSRLHHKYTCNLQVV